MSKSEQNRSTHNKESKITALGLCGKELVSSGDEEKPAKLKGARFSYTIGMKFWCVRKGGRSHSHAKWSSTNRVIVASFFNWFSKHANNNTSYEEGQDTLRIV